MALPPPRFWLHPAHFISAGFGAGLCKYSPGTVGTAVLGLPMWWLLSHLSTALYLGATMLLFAFGVWVCGITNRALGVQDHGAIVLDEMVGFLMTMWAVPVSVTAAIAGFLLFRLFDIWKPYPIRKVDGSVTGGFGVMLDDLLAGVYANICLLSFYFIFT